MVQYPATVTPDDNGTLLVQFPDVPEAITFGEDLADALARASEALEAALSLYIEQRKDLPAPSRASRGMQLVGLPLVSDAKASLYTVMREQGVRKAELARRLGLQKSQVDRLLNLNHHSHIHALEAALAVLGKRLSVSVQDEA